MENLKISFSVAGVSRQTRPAVVELNGATVSVNVPEIEVELTDPINQHGSLTLHFRSPEEQSFALANFIQGETVELSVPGKEPSISLEEVPA